MLRLSLSPSRFTDDELAPAIAFMRINGLVAYPTETVYGLGASMASKTAVERIFEIKGREPGKPVSLMISEPSMLADLCREVTELAQRLISEFWPGPLTLVFKASPGVPEYLQSKQGTVGIRCPDHQLSVALVRLLGAPITSTSANLSGQPAPVDAQGVIAQLGNRLDCLIDSGACRVQTPSTVVDVTGDRPVLLRPGAIDFTEIERHAKGAQP